MQTTLLGIAIAIILALVTALVGPLFVDWNKYRGQFETRASRLIGLQVRVAGPIDARLLPTPTLTLQRIDISRPGDAGAVRARRLGIEFSLSALMRGEWRATDLRVEGAELELGLDASGHLDWPAPSIGFDPDALSIERIEVSESRAILADATSGSGLVLENLSFKGDLRSLVGPIKGEGTFVLAGQNYPYRIAAGRPGDGGAVRVRLGIDPVDRPMGVEADASVWIEGGTPRYEGTLNLLRPVGRAATGAQTLITEPWRVSSKIKGDGKAAVLEQIEFQYGPDDRAMKLKGDAKLTFGGQPQFDGVLSATQLDLDRLLALPEASRKRPLIAIKALTDYFVAGPRLPFPVKIGVSAENVTLAGATLQRVSGDVRTDGETWDVENLDFRAPGAAQIRISGRISTTPQGVSFAGPAKIDARDPRGFVAWLTDRADTPAASGPFRAEGEIRAGNDLVAIERLRAEVDRMSLEGRLAYSWGNADHPARIEATLAAPQLNLDRVVALAKGVFGDTTFEWPREGTLALKVGLVSFGGVEASGADVNMQFNGSGLQIERLSVSVLGGAALSVKGRIDTSTLYPHGGITLDLDARSLDGITTLVDKFAPQVGDLLRRKAASLTPVKLLASLTVNSEVTAAGSPGIAGFRVEGTAGSFRIRLQGNAGADRDAFTMANISKLLAAKVTLTGRVESSNGSRFVEFLGLDRLLAVDARAGQLNLAASGPLDGDMTVFGQLTAGGLDITTKGSARIAGRQGPTAGLDVNVASASLRNPRPFSPGQPAAALPAAFTTKLALAEGTVRLSDLSGKIAGTDINGRLKIGFKQPTSIDGDISVGAINLPVIIATIIGVPAESANGTAPWPSEPFEPGLFDTLSGQIKVKSKRVAFTPTLNAQDLTGVLIFDQSEISLDDVDGTLGGGRIAASVVFRHGKDGISTTSRIGLAAANIGDLLPAGGAPMTGQLTLNVDVEGAGRSPVALIGSLEGSGTFTLQDGRITRLNPAAFETLIRNVDQGLPIDATRIRDRMELALVNGGLSVPLAEGEIAVAAGQTRLKNAIVRAERADLTIAGGVDLAEGSVDAKLTLSGPAGAGGASVGRPEIGIVFKGPIGKPKRTLDVVALASWLALRAVEQQAKRIEALESRREEVVPAPGVPAATVPQVPATASATAETAPQPIHTGPEGPVQPPRSHPVTPPQSGPIDIRPQLRASPPPVTTPRGSSSLQNSIGP